MLGHTLAVFSRLEAHEIQSLHVVRRWPLFFQSVGLIRSTHGGSLSVNICDVSSAARRPFVPPTSHSFELGPCRKLIVPGRPAGRDDGISPRVIFFCSLPAMRTLLSLSFLSSFLQNPAAMGAYVNCKTGYSGLHLDGRRRLLGFVRTYMQHKRIISSLEDLLRKVKWAQFSFRRQASC